MEVNRFQPLVTIITATYNSSMYLEETIRSVINQTYINIEYIIIDGGSTDDTLKIISKYENNIKHIVSEPDNGVYDAWNKGIKLSLGEWVAFLGSDDILYPNAVESYMKFIKRNPNLDYISSKVNYIKENGKLQKVIGEKWEWSKFQRLMKVAHVGSLHNKSLYKKYGLYNLDYKIVADYEFLLRSGNKLNAGFLNQATVEMRTGGISYSYKAIFESYKARKNTGKRQFIYASIDLVFQLFVFSLIRIKSIYN